jgi:hypothetical protein
MKKINRKAKRFLLSVKILYLLNKILTIDFTGEILSKDTCRHGALKQSVKLRDMVTDFLRHFNLHLGEIQELIGQ